MLDLAECITIADGACDILLNRLGNEPEMKGRSGGFLCIADKKGQVLLLTQIGDVPEEMLGRYSRNAVEKAQRLAWTSQYAGHTLSRQSRDEARERWIGRRGGGGGCAAGRGGPLPLSVAPPRAAPPPPPPRPALGNQERRPPPPGHG